MVDLEGLVKPSTIESDVYNGKLGAIKHTEVPSGMIMRVDYTGRSDGQAVYQGFAPTGTAEETNGWVIYKFTYDASNNMLTRNIAGMDEDANWTARADYTYD